MTTGAPPDLEVLPERCAQRARDIGLAPTGSASPFEGVLLVEWPLPWPSDPNSIADLRPAIEAFGTVDESWRLQLVASDVAVGADEPRTLIAYRWDRAASSYRRIERREVPADRVGSVAAELVLTSGDPGDPVAAGQLGDFLICAHGSRDACCGSRGTAMFKAVVAEHGTQLSGAARSTRIWRTSHLGGHRFAPTGLSLPDGQAWAYLDPETVTNIIGRIADPAALGSHYRGSSSIGSAEIQAAEAEAFRRHGWSWLDATRGFSHRPGADGDEVIALINYRTPDGLAGGYEARVRRVGTVTMPPCRAVAGKMTADEQFRVVAFRTVAATADAVTMSEPARSDR